MKLLVIVALFLVAVNAIRPDATARTAVVDHHNQVRATVDPPAVTPLNPLSYSNGAEDLAEGWANRCTWGHRPWSGADGRIPYGENLFAGSGNRTGNPASLLTDASASWASEIQYYELTESGDACVDPDPNDGQGVACGHYTQQVWNTTFGVGCAYQFCPTVQGTSWTNWTIVVCNYEQTGNWGGEIPYEPDTSGGTCTPRECAVNECGSVADGCGQTIDCGPCCDDLCTTNECGNVQNSCGAWLSCGGCASGENCEAGGDGTNSCVAVETCDPAQECANLGYSCGSATVCGTNQQCGSCASGELCENFECVADPCFGCPAANTECVNDQCQCQAGFVEDASGACVQPTTGSNPDFSGEFEQRQPVGDSVFILESDAPYGLSVTSGAPAVILWKTSTDVLTANDKYNTRVEFNVDISSGDFGIGFRHGQNTGSRADDRIMFRLANINSGQATVQVCHVWYGSLNCWGSYGTYTFAPQTSITLLQSFDDATGDITGSLQFQSGPYFRTFSVYYSEAYFPAIGGISFYFDTNAGSVTDLILATSTTLTVSLEECIDDAEWEDLFNEYVGGSAQVAPVRDSGESANCGKHATTGKALVSAFSFVVTSTSVPAASLGSIFTSSVGTPAGASIGLVSATQATGSAAALAAGFPASVAALPGAVSSGAAAGAGAGAGAGGAAAGGLSGGAIAGIVVGSVAGAVLLVGVAAIVVAAVVVGAVIIASGDDDGSVEVDGRKRRASSIRQSIRGIFGGDRVDVMNNPESKNSHQSITARSPGV